MVILDGLGFPRIITYGVVLMTKNFRVTSRDWDELNDAEKAGFQMEARNAASVILERNSGNNPSYVLAVAKELERQAQERQASVRAKQAKRNPDGTFTGPQSRNEARTYEEELARLKSQYGIKDGERSPGRSLFNDE